ncbi:hypothetical protein GHT06_010585 [Daphnia sinensis]|uniref:Uncharacterized protein n=1 Tax=Daphnia sinensis TaxID=1820382 RepID=A0AAD5PZ92_9CRUS|nr:hypothetical protein GHT06_010585 [Daphnia sinensis]
MATLHSSSTGGGVASGAAGGRTSVVRAPISASLPSLFARTLPTTQSNRQPASRDRRGRLVSTECQTEMEDSVSVQQNVRVENARNETGILLDPNGRRSRPVSQLSESGLSGVEEAVTDLERVGPPRRRRREKRRHRRSQVPAQPLQQHVQQALHDQTELSVDSLAAPVSPSSSDHLPDILNAHMPPPYSTLPHNSERCMGMGPIPITALPVPLSVVPMAIGPTAASGGLLVPPSSTTTPAVVVPAGGGTASLLAASNSFTLPPAGGRRSRGSMYAGEESGKSCCGVMVTQTVSIRWFIVMIAFVGICCAVVGTVLGAMRSSGREHLTVSLLMIGVGIVLITVSTIAWRLTSQDAPSCRAMMGLGGSSMTGAGGLPVAENGECGAGLTNVGGVAEPSGRRFLSRIPPTYGRPHHPYAAMMYPEFQYRPPPPSYQASMQEYRLRLLLLDRDRHQQQMQQQQQQQQQHSTPLSRACVAASNVPVPPVSPPPTYRSQANTLVRPSLPIRESEISRPPSYRSRSSASTALEARSECQPPAPQRAEEPTPSTEALIHHQAMVEAKIKSAPFDEGLHSQTSKRDKDNNTVTIVQTNSSSQVLGCHNGQSSPVLVTVTTSPTVHQPSSASPTNSQNLQVLAQL